MSSKLVQSIRALALGALCSAAHAQSWPSKPIRVIVPFTPGSGTDIIARTVGEKVSHQLGQPVVVENRPGAGGTIGSAIVAKSEPDGYTLLVHSSSYTVTPSTYKDLPYDTLRDLTGVVPLGLLPNVLVMAPSKEIRMIESGGLSGDSIQVGYIEPLKAKTGITVVRESPSSLGKLRALVESGQTTTTLFELGSGIVLQAKKLGLIEKIDWAAVNPAEMYPEAKAEYGFGYQYFSTIMAWRSDAKAPKTW
ncbi:MAG TPA: tripartite tricarboxylate transporter substrate-binding protein, partial [Burkholderiales bacterium]|nr:tripartite tricarboxylate transporter substrate-binding protein [Burkholderiales bacterium]